ncbi:MAG: hypothetical protein BWY76_01265 [bacterium ADurb.Bin429]|nr:MAG: hypothetical protein BWY76_01265 [bacterium ADurb.Bin429]
MSDIQYSTESSEWPERACYGCRHHMGCTRKQQGFLGCQCHDAHHRKAETVSDYPDECGPIVAEMM